MDKDTSCKIVFFVSEPDLFRVNTTGTSEEDYLLHFHRVLPEGVWVQIIDGFGEAF